jgi:ATP-binding cassette subfamily D (ALD) long-chain fatty acid import protein
MAPVFSKMDVAKFTAAYGRHRPMVQRVLNIGFMAWTLGGTYLSLRAKPSNANHGGRSRKKGKGADADASTNEPTKPKRIQVDAVFYQRLRTLLRIVIPGIRSKEAMLLIMHSSLLVFRTAISIYVANLDGK